jgi:hypothetical protein
MKLHVTQKEQLEKMKVIQKQVMMHPQKDTFTMLDNEQVCICVALWRRGDVFADILNSHFIKLAQFLI